MGGGAAVGVSVSDRHKPHHPSGPVTGHLLYMYLQVSTNYNYCAVLVHPRYSPKPIKVLSRFGPLKLIV